VNHSEPVSPRARLPLMLLALVVLLAALWAGLIRIGWAVPALGVPVAQHGALMIAAFLGALIALERAVALGRRAAYLAPLLNGLGGMALLLGAPAPLARGLLALGGLGLVLIFVAIVRRARDTAHVTMGVGALLLLAGNVLWLLDRPLYVATPWWVGFLVLTIAGERLELARVLLVRRDARVLFAGVCALFLAGLLLSLAAFDLGVRVAGAGLVALGLWLLRYDLARRTIRAPGLTRFIAACLLPGYAWLAVGGVLWVAWGGVAAGLQHDAMLHTILLGFAFSMIFGHAPVIVPGVLGTPVNWHPVTYGYLALLHAALLLRVAGDLLLLQDLRAWGGLLNVVAILWFMGTTAWLARTSPPAPSPERKERAQERG
jgi:hypothetical protein